VPNAPREAREPQGADRALVQYAMGVYRRHMGIDLLAPAPRDVADAVQLLRQRDFEVVSAHGGATAPFGDRAIVLRGRVGSADAEITVIRDRSQWRLEFRLPEWQTDADLGILLEISGHIQPEGRTSLHEPKLAQLPGGVSWVEMLPRVLQWLDDSHPTWSDLDDALAQRATRLGLR
jgi:hypothetical protein